MAGNANDTRRRFLQNGAIRLKTFRALTQMHSQSNRPQAWQDQKPIGPIGFVAGRCMLEREIFFGP